MADTVGPRVTVDHTLPGGSPAALRQLVQNADNIVQEIRRDVRNPKKKRGPARQKLRLTYYLLPDDSPPPQTTSARDAHVRLTHHQCGFGFPFGMRKPQSCNMGLSRAQYNSFLRQLYPRQGNGAWFDLFLNNRSTKGLDRVENHDDLYNNKSVIFLRVSTSHDQQEESDDDVQHPVETESLDLDPEPVEPEAAEPARVPQYPAIPVVPAPAEPTRPTATPIMGATPQQEQQLTVPVQLDAPTTSTVEESMPSRRDLIAEQDTAFSRSLQLDRERERSRLEARERQRMARRERQQDRETRRAQLEEERMRLLTSLGEEPEEGILIRLRMPDGDLYRRFARDTVCSSLYTYLRARYGVNIAYRIYWQNEVLPDDDTTIESRDIHQSCVMNVDIEMQEDDEEQDDAESLYSEASERDNRTPEYTINSFEDLKERAADIKRHLTTPRTIMVKRKSIFDDLVDVYTSDKNIVHHELYVQIEGEPAVDAEGVKREVFTVFFRTLLIKYFFGNEEMVPQLDPKVLFTGLLETIGRIISHAFVLVGVFPVGICKAGWHLMLTGSASTEAIVGSFLRILTERERKVTEKVIEGKDLSDIEALSFLSVLSSHGCKNSPSAQDRLRTLENVAATSLLCKPLYCYGRILEGMHCYPLMWLGIKASVIDDIYSQMKPCANSIVNMINYQYTDLEDHFTVGQYRDIRVAEERVKMYLERYIETLSDIELAALMQFWTGSELSVLSSLFVGFNALQGTARRPTVNSCLGQLNLSRYYTSQEEFDEEMCLYLGSMEASQFDSI